MSWSSVSRSRCLIVRLLRLKPVGLDPEGSCQATPAVALPHTTLSSPPLPHTILSPPPLPHTMLSPGWAVPQSSPEPSVLPQTTLSQLAPPQSLPHTMLSLVLPLPHTMLSQFEGSHELPHTMLSAPPLPHTTLSPLPLPQTMLSPLPLPHTMLSPPLAW